MKAQLTINLPDGWELAEPEARKPKRGETFLDNTGVAEVADGDYTIEMYPILHRTRSEYVNVKMLRADAELAGKSISGRGNEWVETQFWTHFSAACREALAAADKEV